MKLALQIIAFAKELEVNPADVRRKILNQPES